MHDGTFHNTYFHLRMEGGRIAGSIRLTQFFYKISASSGGADGFTITGSMMDGRNQRKVVYEGKLGRHEDVTAGAEYTASVPAHGVVLFRVR
jgi:hypothetical protein